jgi:hypothetical protein
MSEEANRVSIVTIMRGNREFCPLICHNYQNFVDGYDLELVIVDDGKEDLSSEFSMLDNCLYLNIHEDQEKFFKQIFESHTSPNKTLLKYQRIINALPNGFKRDYGCGVSSHPYIFHMNADCSYSAKAIDRKFRYMKRVGAECVYCDTSLAYDIYNQKLYKTQSPHKIYESTLFHARDFWKRRGFQWGDVEVEGKYFHYNNGSDRKLDNYYDTIQLLTIHNMNQYHPVEVTLEGLDISPPKLVSEIQVVTHPFVKILDDIYEGEIDILGINSEFLENVSYSTWDVRNITEKWKQTKLAKHIQKEKTSYNVLVYGSKHPAWDLFEHIPFDIILLETHKNKEQMMTIIQGCRNYSYLYVQGMFLRERFIEGEQPGPEPEPE